MSSGPGPEKTWFIRIYEDVHGPYTSSQLRKLIQQGKIDESTEVRRASKTTWRRAGLMCSLYPRLRPAAPKKPEASPQIQKHRPRTLKEIEATDGLHKMLVYGGLAIFTPICVGFLFANFDLAMTTGERVLVFLGTCVVLWLVTIPVFIHQFSPKSREASKKKADQIGRVGAFYAAALKSRESSMEIANWVGGAVVFFAIVAVGGFFLFHFTPNSNTGFQTVDLPNRKEGEWTRYKDPQGRFHCDIPPGWSIKAAKKNGQSLMLLNFKGHEIRVTVRETKQHKLFPSDQKGMTRTMEIVAKKLGRDGKVVRSVWTTLAGSRALQFDLVSEREKRFVRSIKSKHLNGDHFIAIYVDPSDEREEMCQLFQEFLNRYDRVDDNAAKTEKVDNGN